MKFHNRTDINARLLKDFTKYLTGPELPLIDLDNCTIPDGNFTCETSLDNVVDVYYFDDADTFSCKDQVSQIVIINGPLITD